MRDIQALIPLNPVAPDFALTAATLCWNEGLKLEEACAISGLSQLEIIELIEARLLEVLTEHARLMASGMLQELVARTSLWDVMQRLRNHVDEMTPGQLLNTGAFLQSVSNLKEDRALVRKGEEAKFEVRILSADQPDPVDFKGGVLIDLRPRVGRAKSANMSASINEVIELIDPVVTTNDPPKSRNRNLKPKS